MDNTWYYTLSTIVQGIASIFGLSATFLVFKLQTINPKLRIYRNKAIKSLVYIEGKSETKYEDISLLDLSEKFFEETNKLVSFKNYLGIGQVNYYELRNKWAMMVENGFANVGDKVFDEYFVFLLRQNARAFKKESPV